MLKRFEPVRQFLSVASIGLLVFPLYFLLNYSGLKPSNASPVTAGKEMPVVIVVFDEFPVLSLLDDHHQVDAVRYPNFAALAKESTWFPNATTVHSDTSGAVPAILTGRYPPSRATSEGERCLNPLPTIKAFPENLFTMLGQAYKLNIFEAYLFLCPSRFCPAPHQQQGFLKAQLTNLKVLSRNYLSHILFRQEHFNPLFEKWRQDVVSERKNLASHHIDIQTTEQFIQALKTGKPGKNLYFFHAMVPHIQWEFYPSGKRYPLNSLIENESFECTAKLCPYPAVNRFLHQRHLLQVGYTDRVLGRITAAMRASGLYDKSLFIVMADHGISFQDRSFERKVHQNNMAEILSIPLFIKQPEQQAGRIDTRHAESIDILATVLDVLKIQSPASVAGHSLLSKPGENENGGSLCSPEKKVAYSLPEFRQGFEQALLQKSHRSGSGNPGALFAPEPYRSLLGQSVENLKPAVSNEFEVKFPSQLRQNLRSVNPQAEVLPLIIEGQLLRKENSAVESAPIAIAVNEKISAVTQSGYIASRRLEFFASPIPENALKAGENKVGIFTVKSTASGLKLERLGDVD